MYELSNELFNIIMTNDKIDYWIWYIYNNDNEIKGLNDDLKSEKKTNNWWKSLYTNYRVNCSI